MEVDFSGFSVKSNKSGVVCMLSCVDKTQGGEYGHEDIQADRTLKWPAREGGFRLAASRRPFGDGSTRPRGQGFAQSSTTTEIFG